MVFQTQCCINTLLHFCAMLLQKQLYDRYSWHISMQYKIGKWFGPSFHMSHCDNVPIYVELHHLHIFYMFNTLYKLFRNVQKITNSIHHSHSYFMSLQKISINCSLSTPSNISLYQETHFLHQEDKYIQIHLGVKTKTLSIFNIWSWILVLTPKGPLPIRRTNGILGKYLQSKFISWFSETFFEDRKTE